MEQGTNVSWKAWGFWALPFFLFVLVVAGLKSVLSWSVSDATYLATGLAVVAYTVETWKMRRELVRQNEIAIQPLMIAVIEERPPRSGSGPYEPQFILRNIGRGPGLHIEVKDIKVLEVEGWVHRAKFKITEVDCIEPGKEAVAELRVEAEASGVIEPLSVKVATYFLEQLNPCKAGETCAVIISYEDISGQPRWSKVQMGKGGIRLLDHGKGESPAGDGEGR